MDLFFRDCHSIFIHNNPEAVSLARPARYVEIEKELVDRNKSVPEAKKDASGHGQHMESV